MQRLLLSLLFILPALWLNAQADDPILIEDINIITVTDVFGLEQQVASGIVINNTDDAYADLQIFAEIYDADGEIIGEGFGFLTNQCGESVPFDFVLQPGSTQRFATTLEFYEDDIIPDEFLFTAQGRALDSIPETAAREFPGVTLVSDLEIAGVEWHFNIPEPDGDPSTEEIPTVSFIFGEGCHRDIFTTYDWYAYDLDSGDTSPIEHPRSEAATNPAMRERLNLLDDTEYRRSMLMFPPRGGNRLVHQDVLNTLVTAEIDGTFRRIIDDELFRSTLQGINWMPDNMFVAYYYGAYGDDVTYLLANTSGTSFSTPERFSIPSVTVPGAFDGATNLIVSGQFNDDETPGFYLKPPAADRFDLLFAWENLPGNNYPAPVHRARGGAQSEDVVYLALPDANDEPRLYCYDRREGELFDLSPLPLDLGTTDRATMILSPDKTQIALGVDGVNGGLWLLELGTFDTCNDV